MSATTLVGDLINWSKCKTSDGRESLHSPVKTAAIDLGIDPMGYSEECDIADLVFEEIAERIQRDYLLRPACISCDIAVPVQLGQRVANVANPYMGYEQVTEMDYRKNVDGEYWYLRGSGGLVLQSLHVGELTKELPDTQEEINKDARKKPCEYFNGNKAVSCPDCARYKREPENNILNDMFSCDDAKTLDLVKRQRRLLGADE